MFYCVSDRGFVSSCCFYDLYESVSEHAVWRFYTTVLAFSWYLGQNRGNAVYKNISWHVRKYFCQQFSSGYLTGCVGGNIQKSYIELNSLYIHVFWDVGPDAVTSSTCRTIDVLVRITRTELVTTQTTCWLIVWGTKCLFSLFGLCILSWPSVHAAVNIFQPCGLNVLPLFLQSCKSHTFLTRQNESTMWPQWIDYCGPTFLFWYQRKTSHGSFSSLLFSNGALRRCTFVHLFVCLYLCASSKNMQIWQKNWWVVPTENPWESSQLCHWHYKLVRNHYSLFLETYGISTNQCQIVSALAVFERDTELLCLIIPVTANMENYCWTPQTLFCPNLLRKFEASEALAQ